MEKNNVIQNNNVVTSELKGRIQNNFSGFLRVCLVGLLVLFQFLIIFILPYMFHAFTVYFYVVMEVFSLMLIVGLTNETKSPSYKIAWFSIVLMLPISGYIMYCLWGKSRKNKLEKRIINKISYGNIYLEQDKKVLEDFVASHPVSGRMSKYMVSENFPLYKNNQVEYYPMGEDNFQAIFMDLEKAEKFILMDFFIVAEGAIWDKLHEILLRKLEQGIEVKFIYDDFGAMIRTNKDFKRNLEREGFEVRIFNPIHKYTEKLFMNYRSHHKIIVIDGNIGYTGGYNIADEYANLVERFGVWKDTGIRLEGEAVWGLTVIFLQMWGVCSFDEYVDYNKYRPNKKFPETDIHCHVISDGPVNNPNNPIETVYRQMISYAGVKLYIMTPYLVIEDNMRDTLIEAVKRGVDVRIITPNIPDKRNVKWLTNYNYGILLKNGIRIFEYTPGFIHAKVILNEHCAIVGTINMDYRSFYLHYENGVWMHDGAIIKKIDNDFSNTFKCSREITYEEWKNRPYPLKAVQQFLNLFSTML